MESANEMKLIFESRSINESFARVTVGIYDIIKSYRGGSIGCKDCGFRSSYECDHSRI